MTICINNIKPCNQRGNDNSCNLNSFDGLTCNYQKYPKPVQDKIDNGTLEIVYTPL